MLSLIYLAGLLLAEALRFPLRIRLMREGGPEKRQRRSFRISEGFVLAAVLFGFWILPLTYSFTDWLSPLDYHLPFWAAALGLGIFTLSLVLRWLAQRALARHWSYTLETRTGQRLVTGGIYGFSRHPLYLSLIFWSAAQPLLLQNWLAGLGGLLATALIWFVRVPREERMMHEAFGEEYREYCSQTGRLFPRYRYPTFGRGKTP
jgi:protein-S-isoprenylcysteine O-methyltransferase Ste14